MRKGRLVPACVVAVACFVLGLASHDGVAHDIPGRPGGTTYHRDVVPILQEHCQRCHRDGGVAPFALTSYESARANSGAMIAATRYGTMPPMPVRLGAHEFEGPRRLRAEEVDILEDWLADGLQAGDPADAPPPVTFEDERAWKLGEPDVVLFNAPRGYRVPANPTPGVHNDRFQCFYVPVDSDAERWITGVEIRPGVDAVVHHVLLYLDPEHRSRDFDREAPGPGYEHYSGLGFVAPVLLSWNPGAPPVTFAEGVGVRIPRGAALAMQIHYAYDDQPRIDRTAVGLHFARSPVHKERIVLQPKNEIFTLPADVRGSRVDAWVRLFEDTTIDSLTPHQHRLGYEMAVEAILPGGATDELIHVDWDVFHQGTYVLKEPVHLPLDTVIHVWGLYDNTAANPLNPYSPPQEVHWGRESFNEMCFAFVGVTRDAEDLPTSRPVAESISVRHGRLEIRGTGFLPGARIESAGVLFHDTKIDVDGAVATSVRRWRGTRPRARTASRSFRVLNPDGAASNELQIDPR